MSEIVKVGGIGKNPAIDKINKINEVNVKQYARDKMEEIFLSNSMVEREYDRYVPIDFSKAGWRG